MADDEKRNLSIYVHIPFCKSKCIYCDFLSFGGCDYLEQKEYINALCNEIAAWKSISKDYRVKTIFFGGGTPSYMDAGLLIKVFKQIRYVFEISMDAEITIEGNPDSLRFENLKAYREAGINRLSIGLQSANNEVLLALNRVHNYDQFLAAFGSARTAGFNNINIDVMSGLPGESQESYIHTLGKVADLCPEHISAYSLIVEEGTPLAANQALLDMLPTEEEDRILYARTKMLLKNSGYNRYEISNYAREGFECRHNTAYWTGEEYLGLGLGASSYLKIHGADGTWETVRFSGMEKPGEYVGRFCSNFFESVLEEELQSQCSCQEENMVVSLIRDYYMNVSFQKRKDSMEEFVFLGLRMMKGISMSAFQEKFGVAIESIYGKIIDKYVGNGLLVRSGDRLYLSDKGIDVSNVVMAEFML